MNNATSMLWRSSCGQISTARLPIPRPSLLAKALQAQSLEQLTLATGFLSFSPLNRSWPRPLQRSLTGARSFHNQTPPLSNAPGKGPSSKLPGNKASLPETGFSARQIAQIFGTTRVTCALGNRVLNTLQQHRTEGTLDHDLPDDIARQVPTHLVDQGLAWLRKNHPMDEDAAILGRIEREEQQEEERLISRAEELGIYKPQSGRFGAPIAKEGDVYGNSVLDEVRAENEKAAKQKEKDTREEWLSGEEKRLEKLKSQLSKHTGMQKYEESGIIEARPRADPSSRPALAWIQRYHLNATDTDDASSFTKKRRILPSLAVTLLVVGVSYVYAETYEAPPNRRRMWSDITPAAATAVGLITANIAVCALWRFPPCWRMLNKYFITVPMAPNAFSMVGSMFSHQQLRHLAMNMCVLWFIGTRLHDEIGRGDFLALYLSAGAIASLTSLSAHVLRNNLAISTLGASGAIAGLVAMWCMLHSNDKLTFALLPQHLQEKFSASGSTFLCSIVLVELVSLVSPFRLVAVDYWSHLGGLAAGALIGYLSKQKKKHERKQELGWWTRFF
ncbi:hypothetical protein FQN57_001029 [Myotisia sp. PD_48]|nr:hypothetical protein FQN57_001029 [Myotisia sp. PD_48]